MTEALDVVQSLLSLYVLVAEEPASEAVRGALPGGEPEEDPQGPGHTIVEGGRVGRARTLLEESAEEELPAPKKRRRTDTPPED